MAHHCHILLTDFTIRIALKQAWEDSQPGITGGHEEGGFIVLDSAGNLEVFRWPKAGPKSIILPPHQNCKFDKKDIVATFHTHLNTGNDYLQEPSKTNKRAVRDDPDLKGEFYEGEFVISQEKIYLIAPNGQMTEAGDTLMKHKGKLTMAATLMADVLQDDIAISLARAIAVANKRARELGIDVLQSLITITQPSFNNDLFWRINYGPKNYIGRRGGDLIIEVDQSGISIHQVLWGQ